MTGEQYDDALFALVRKRLRAREIRDWVAAGASALALLMIGVAGALVMLAQTPRQSPPQAPVPVVAPTLGTLPACDDDAPGRPITGPCWLMDDGGLALWPYPYAPTPLAVLGGYTP